VSGDGSPPASAGGLVTASLGLASLGAIARADRESLGAPESPEPGAILPGEVTR
jgi:hypothetical protein